MSDETRLLSTAGDHEYEGDVWWMDIDGNTSGDIDAAIEDAKANLTGGGDSLALVILHLIKRIEALETKTR